MFNDNRPYRVTAILAASTIFFILVSCFSDHGLEPIRSNIQGTITYSGQWPAAAAEVRLVTATKFPPSGVSDLIIGESIPLTGDSYDYNFYLKPGTYDLVGVAWREQNSIWDIISICGIYFSGTNSLSPGEIIIPTDTSQVSNINIFVDRAKARQVTNTKITGSVKFEGVWPDSILEVRVIATTKFNLFPTVLPTLLDLSFSNSITTGVDSSDYSINAFPATYVATAVIFFKSGQSLSFNDIVYSLNAGGLNLTPYTTIEDNTTIGPDFFIRF
jgi:hypothetical protein